MEAPPSSIPNKLFLSGSDLHTPFGDETHTPSSRLPVNGASSSSVGTFAVKAGLAQMFKIRPLVNDKLIVRRRNYGCCQVNSFPCVETNSPLVLNRLGLPRKPVHVLLWL